MLGSEVVSRVHIWTSGTLRLHAPALTPQWRYPYLERHAIHSFYEDSFKPLSFPPPWFEHLNTFLPTPNTCTGTRACVNVSTFQTVGLFHQPGLRC